MSKTFRYLIIFPAILFALFAPQANAEPIAGLNTTYYTIDEIPPTAKPEGFYTWDEDSLSWVALGE